MTIERDKRRVLSFSRGTVSRDAAWSLVYSTLVRVATVGLSVAVARLIGSAGAGAFGVALQVTALGSMIAVFNLPQSLTKRLAEFVDPGSRRALLLTSAALVAAGGLLVGLTVLLASGPLADALYRDSAVQPVLFACGPMIMANAGYLWVEGALQGLRRFDSLARWGAVVSAFDLVCGVIAAFFGVFAVIVVRALVRAAATILIVYAWLRRGGVPDSGRPIEASSQRTATPLSPPVLARGAVAGTLIAYAGPALLTAGIVLLGQTALRVLLVRRSGLVAAGHYQVADSIAQGLMLIPTAAATAFMPAVSRDQSLGNADLARSLQRALEQVSGFNLGLCLVAIGVLPWAITPLFGGEFAPARPVLVLLAAAYGLTGPAVIFGAVLLGRGEVWTGFFANAAWATVVLGVFWFITSSMGATGAAIAVGAGYVVLLLICFVVLLPAWRISRASVVPPLMTTFISIGLATALAFTPSIPAALTAVVCVMAGAAIFVRWGLPSLAESPLPGFRN